MKPKNKKYLSQSLAFAIGLSVQAMSFAQTPPVIAPPTPLNAEGSSSGSRGDGFSLLGQFGVAGKPIKIPNFSDEQLHDQIAELRATRPDTSLKYEDLFNPQDQAAFDEVQAQFTIRMHIASKNLYKVKKLLTEGYVVYTRFQNDSTSDRNSQKRMLGIVASTYTNTMREAYERAIEIMSPRSGVQDSSYGRYIPQDTNYAYKIAADGSVSALALVDQSNILHVIESVFGVADFSSCSRVSASNGSYQDCDWRLAQGGTIMESAQALCRTAACAFEIGKITQDMMNTSQALQERVRFENIDINHSSLFIDPQHSMLRYALSNYIDRVTDNKEISGVGAGLVAVLGLSKVVYVPIMSLIDGIANIRSIRTTFNFTPGTWSDGYSRRNARDELRQEIDRVSASKLQSGMSQY